jgi:signal transduction histidine kinase
MNLFGLSGLLVCITSFSLAIFLSFKGRKRLSFVWAFYSFFCSIWGLGGFLISTTKDYALCFKYWQIAYIGVIPLPAFFFHFICLFLGLNRGKVLRVVYLLTIFFEIINIFYGKLFFGKIEYMFDELFWTTSSGLFLNIYTVTLICGIITYAHYELIRAFIKTKNLLKKTQIKYFFVGAALGWGGALFCFMLNYKLYYGDLGRYYPLGNFGVMLYPIIYTYAILRYRLMDISVVIKKSLFYSSLIAILSGIYLLLIFIMESAFKGLVGYRSSIVSLLAAFSMAILFNPIRNRLQAFVDKLFLGKSPQEIAHENDLLRHELERSDRLKAASTLALGLAHEIKNPLTTIKTFSEFIKEKHNDPEFIDKFSRLVPSEVERINNIVHRLLDFSKPAPPSFQKTNISQLIDDILEFLNSEFLKHHIVVEKNYEKDDCLIKIDPSQIKQVLLNIFLNAIEAMPKGGKITVKTITGSDGTLEIDIADTGSGISKEHLKHIFDPFFTTKDSGSGLGLSIVHQIIQNHGGKITAESEIDIGTEFRIKLPLLN